MFSEDTFIWVICESPFLLFTLSPLPLECHLSPVSSPHCRGQSFLVNECLSEREDSGCYDTLQGTSVGSRIQCPFLAPSTPVPGGAPERVRSICPWGQREGVWVDKRGTRRFWHWRIEAQWKMPDWFSLCRFLIG